MAEVFILGTLLLAISLVAVTVAWIGFAVVHTWRIAKRRTLASAPTWLKWMSLASVVVSGAWYTMLVRPMCLAGRQVNTCGRLNTLDIVVREYREDHGAYPRTLALTVPVDRDGWLEDVWGNEIYYRSDGNHFLLASYGRDGRPDFSYPELTWSEIGLNEKLSREVHGEWQADQIRSDQGWTQRACH